MGTVKLLRTYDQGAMLFSAPVGNSCYKRLGPTPWAIEVWYDAPAQICLNSVSSDDQSQLMTFQGHLAGHSVNTLFDGGATHNFVSAAFAAAKGLKIHACNGQVLAAGTADIAIQGYVCERVQIQNLSEVVKMYVIDLHGQAMQAVLGQGWLLDHKAVISYFDKCVMCFQGTRHMKLKFRADSHAVPDQPQDCPSLLTSMQLKVMSKQKGAQTLLVNVSVVDEVAELSEEGEIPSENALAKGAELGKVA